MSKRKIQLAVTGPESSGKTVLSIQLAELLSFHLVEEYSRIYLKELNKPYGLMDIVAISKGQQKLERSAMRSFVADTEQTVLKIWAEEKFGECPAEIETAWERQSYDHIFLCKPDLPWEPDPLRENPEDRDRLFDIYLKSLQSSGQSFSIIEGQGDVRIQKALEKLKSLHLL